MMGRQNAELPKVVFSADIVIGKIRMANRCNYYLSMIDFSFDSKGQCNEGVILGRNYQDNILKKIFITAAS